VSKPLRVLLILGHPRESSFGAALFDAFRAGAVEAGVDLCEIRVSALSFDPDVHYSSPNDQPLEPDLRDAQASIAWAEHLVLVYPTWWGTAPARLKGFLDRVLTPGFAFQHDADGGWTPLLRGKTAQLLTTMDTPSFVYRWMYGSPGYRAIARATLGFCGVRTVRKTRFGPMITATDDLRAAWLAHARAEGLRLRAGPLARWQRGCDRAARWIRALRLKFYPMSWIAYTVGALLAVRPGPLDVRAYWLGYIPLFLLEAATVFCNDYFDFDSDRRNLNAGPFTGGSRVLVDGSLTFTDVRRGIWVALAGFALVAALLLGVTEAPGLMLGCAYSVLAVLALGYTLPPLKLSHRGIGELDVAVTHSAGVIAIGYAVQGGSLNDAAPWLVSLPLLLAVLPSIILSGVPDFAADRAAGKRTLVVKLGKRGAVRLAMAACAAAAAVGMIAHAYEWASDAYSMLIYGALPHAAWLLWKLHLFQRNPNPPQRIDGLMVLALTYMLWFCAAPLSRLW
jgi:1,4-dihydroxy-2-naphthoate polyprenyltransferase